MRRHIETFRQVNEGLFNDKFLIIYQITNFKTTTNFDDMNRIESSEKISEWKSPVYSYIQMAKSKDIAIDSGWIKHEDKHYCFNCYEHDDNDELIIKNKQNENV